MTKEWKVKGQYDTYTLTLNPISCTCSDFIYRKKPMGDICKHIKQVIDNESKNS